MFLLSNEGEHILQKLLWIQWTIVCFDLYFIADNSIV